MKTKTTVFYNDMGTKDFEETKEYLFENYAPHYLLRLTRSVL